MQSLVSPSLPGQPASPAEEQLIAKLERIDALHQIAHLGRNTLFVTLSELDHDLQEIIGELLWNDGDGGIALAEAAEEAARELPLEITYCGYWHPGEPPEAGPVQITLTVGGPTCWLTGALDAHDQIIPSETSCHFHWGADKGECFVPAHYHESLKWFSSLVVG